MNKNTIIIGGGFSSISAACHLAKAGFQVTILEKNSTIGGRARVLSEKGFKFDIGPTWYWMPDVFESFFNDFGRKPSDYYELKKLSPAYEVYFNRNDAIQISDNIESIYNTFEREEAGSAAYLKKFMKAAKYNYEVAINNLVYQPGESISELITFETIQKANQFFKSIRQEIKGNIKSERLKQIMEFPVLFLGAKPSNTPSFYNFMNYADFGLGTWHPMGGMYEVIKAMKSLAEELGVQIKTNSPVDKIIVENRNIKGVQCNSEFIPAHSVICGADYHHGETLLDKKYRMYSENYWEKRTFAPAALLFFIGFNKKLKNVSHHTLFFDSNFDEHSRNIYDNPQWPENPLFYASFPSKTDSSFAPEHGESATILIPVAPGIEDTDAIRDLYFEKIINRLEDLTGQSVRNAIIFKKSYCVNDFINDYNSYKGNAYGLANTLFQTAVFRPKLRSRKVKNLYFTGQLTVPGPGVPPALISGKIVSELVQKYSHNLKTYSHENAI